MRIIHYALPIFHILLILHWLFKYLRDSWSLWIPNAFERI